MRKNVINISTNRSCIDSIEISADKAKELADTIQKVYDEIAEYRNRERKVLFNVDNLYKQLNFLKHNQERNFILNYMYSNCFNPY